MTERESDDGLYTGDAPVSMPGFDGKAPQRYDVSRSRPAESEQQAVAVRGGLVDAETVPTAPGRRGVVALAAAVAVLGGGIALFMAAPGSDDPDAGTVVVSQAAPADQAAPAALGDTLIVGFADSSYAITPLDAIGQPGLGFAHTTRDDEPQLLVAASVERLGTATDQTGPSAVNWKFETADGDLVDAELMPTYRPHLARTSIAGGERAEGYLAFSTDATEGTLHYLTVFGRDEPQASWQVEARRADTVVGALGRNVWADISFPLFTVRIDAPHVVDGDDPTVHRAPLAGSFLLCGVTVSGMAGTEGHLGHLSTSSFVFVPAGSATADDPFAGAINPSTAVEGALAPVMILGGEEVRATLAFDTSATSGTLYFLDAAERVLIEWAIDL